MPHDEPNWEDVRWNHRASDEAAAALRRAADAIDRTLADEAAWEQGAATEWRGASKSAFDRRRSGLIAELEDLATACRGAAEQVRRAAVQAEQEQRRREHAREEWEREERRRGSRGR